MKPRPAAAVWLGSGALLGLFGTRITIQGGHPDLKTMGSQANVKYFYALTFLGAGAFFLGYVSHFSRNGEMPIRGATFYRRRNPPAFWLFTTLFSLAGLACIAGAVVILLSKL